MIRRLVHSIQAAVSALTLTIWDHCLTLPEEFDLVWFRKFDLTKAVFLFNRYGVEAGLVLVTYGMCNLCMRRLNF